MLRIYGAAFKCSSGHMPKLLDEIGWSGYHQRVERKEA